MLYTITQVCTTLPHDVAHRSSSIQAPRPQPYCSAGNTASAAGANSSSRLTARHRSAADCHTAPYSALSAPGARGAGGVTHSSAGGPVSAMAYLRRQHHFSHMHLYASQA